MIGSKPKRESCYIKREECDRMGKKISRETEWTNGEKESREWNRGKREGGQSD